MDLEKYKEIIEILAKTKSKRIFQNYDEQHAAIVLENLIKYSNQNIIIYDNDLSGDIACINKNFLKELRNFVITKKGKLQILINKLGDKNKFQTEIFRLFKIYPNLIDIRYANDEFKTDLKVQFSDDLFFSVGDNNKFRLEYIEGRKAYCSFNNETYSKILSKIFVKNFYKSKKINA